MRLWPAWKCALTGEHPSYPGAPTLPSPVDHAEQRARLEACLGGLQRRLHAVLTREPRRMPIRGPQAARVDTLRRTNAGDALYHALYMPVDIAYVEQARDAEVLSWAAGSFTDTVVVSDNVRERVWKELYNTGIKVRCGVVWCGAVWCGVVRCDSGPARPAAHATVRSLHTPFTHLREPVSSRPVQVLSISGLVHFRIVDNGVKRLRNAEETDAGILPITPSLDGIPGRPRYAVNMLRLLPKDEAKRETLFYHIFGIHPSPYLALSQPLSDRPICLIPPISPRALILPSSSPYLTALSVWSLLSPREPLSSPLAASI